MSNIIARWKGSTETAATVRQQILERFGSKEAKKRAAFRMLHSLLARIQASVKMLTIPLSQRVDR